MSAHSPGPWRWSDEPVAGEAAWLERDRLIDANGATILCASGDEEVEEGEGEHFEGWVSVQRRDAALIAAAPEMLEILRRIAGLRYAENMDGSADELIARLGYEPIPEERKKFPP